MFYKQFQTPLQRGQAHSCLPTFLSVFDKEFLCFIAYYWLFCFQFWLFCLGLI